MWQVHNSSVKLSVRGNFMFLLIILQWNAEIERPKSGKRQNPNDQSFKLIIVRISVVRDQSFLFEAKLDRFTIKGGHKLYIYSIMV